MLPLFPSTHRMAQEPMEDAYWGPGAYPSSPHGRTMTEMSGQFQTMLATFPCASPLPPPQVNMAHHTSLDVALVLRIYSAASHAHGHSWDLLPRALDLARPCCHCFSFIASAFPPGFAIASGADVAVQAPSMALESLQTNFFPLLWFIPEVPPQSTDRLFLWKCKVF